MVIEEGSAPIGLISDEVLGERALLRGIDRAILEFDDDTEVRVVESLFLDSLEKLCDVRSLSGPAGFLVFMENEFQPLTRPGGEASLGPVRKTATLRRLIEQAGGPASRLVEFGEDQNFFEAIGSAGACLIAPIYTPGGHLLCALVVAADSPEELQRLRQPQVGEAVEDLAAQLTIAYRQFERARHHFEMNRLWDAFLEHNLAPTVCFQILAERIPRFLPTFGPLGAADPSPMAQVLMLQPAGGDPPHEEHLIIRGMTAGEPEETQLDELEIQLDGRKSIMGSRIDILRSITGKLITDPTLPYFYGDPTARGYERFYKNYFPGSGARSELAVRMNEGGACIGIINLESEIKNAFSRLQIRTLLALADAFGRFAVALEKRLTMNTEMQHSVATSTRNYLDALAKTFKHGIRTPLHNEATNAHLLNQQIGDLERWLTASGERAPPAGKPKARASQSIDHIIETLKKTQVRILKDHEEISQYSLGFVDDISGYAIEERLVLRKVMDSAIHLAYHCLLPGDASQIKIGVVSDTSLATTHIYCSTLIKQHLYSVFHNAVEATVERMKFDGRPGRIEVSIEQAEIREGQEKRLNEGWIVRIRDNGAGVDEAQLAELNKFEPGNCFKEGGSGYGLVAAHRYIQSIGGRMKLDSVKGEYFEVAIFFEEDKTDHKDERRRVPSKDRPDGQAT
jgi:signal transduction histidine kinase